MASAVDIHKIDAHISVGGQISPGDVATLKAAGFRSIICNRPDGESFGQPSYAKIAAEAQAQGLEIRFIPIVSGTLNDADIKAQGAEVASLPQPVFAYCRTGTRSATVWALSQAGKQPVDELLAKTAAAGYDLSPLKARLGG